MRRRSMLQLFAGVSVSALSGFRWPRKAPGRVVVVGGVASDIIAVTVEPDVADAPGGISERIRDTFSRIESGLNSGDLAAVVSAFPDFPETALLSADLIVSYEILSIGIPDSRGVVRTLARRVSLRTTAPPGVAGQVTFQYDLTQDPAGVWRIIARSQG